MTRAWISLVLALLPPTTPADGGELSLPPAEAFAMGARIRVRDAAEMDTRAFNRALRAARARGEEWTGSFIQVAVRFAGVAPQGRSQSVAVETAPGGWEGGEGLEWARVAIEDRGYFDDSISGERWVVWLVPAPIGGGLEVARGLRAWECQRSPESWFYSARPCP